MLSLIPRNILPKSQGFLKSSSYILDESVLYNSKLFSYLIHKFHFHTELTYSKPYLSPRQIWVENLDTIEEKKLELINLNSEIFGAQPRVDIIHENVRWQQLYKYVSYAHTKTRAEVKGGGRKPWPQKGLGRARHGSIRSPLWRKGGIAHGPRSPTPYFYLLPFSSRIIGLTSILSIKLAQDNLHIVQEVEVPNESPDFLSKLIEKRNWGDSVLFIYDGSIIPRNISLATNTLKHVNLMPLHGLNIYSILKHNTLVLSKDASYQIEKKLIYHLKKL